MQEKTELLKQIDAAIDGMNIDEAEKILDALTDLDANPIRPEDPGLFAARIMKRSQKLRKENNTMLKPNKGIRIAIVAAAVLVMGVSAYAAGALRFFSFEQDGVFTTFRTTEDMTEEEAKELASQADGEALDGEIPPEAAAAETEDFTFDSIEQASAELDIEIPLPSAMPELALDSASGSVIKYGEDAETRTAWLNYGDVEERLVGITVTRTAIKPGSGMTGFTTHDMDDDSLGSYKSKSGVEYTLLTESDDSGEKTVNIAFATVGEYEYALVFAGFDEAEREAIIDSVDLSVYG